MNELKDFILLIPYYNDFEGLISSLKSIHYPVERFEVLIVDDGSQKPLNESELQTLFAGTHIKVLRMEENKGIVHALNLGLQYIKNRADYNYIARLDCGDICTKERFALQVNFMDSHKEIGLLGSWCTFTEKGTGRSYIYKTKLEHSDIVKEMHFKCSFIHPTAMFRREVIDTIGLYPENYPHAEDYAYFWQMLKPYKGHILSETLVNVVVSSNNVSSVNYKNQLKSRMKVVSKFGNSVLLKFLGNMVLQIKSLLPLKVIRRAKYFYS